MTRRPLILQLFNTQSHPYDTNDHVEHDVPTAEVISSHSKSHHSNKTTTTVKAIGKEWGEFLHIPGRKFYDFGQIRQEIVDDTERLTGNNKGISKKPIHLKIYSPYVLALTLVDLPGIAKVPVGDQPQDIERQIHEMCVSYISNPNAIILAVTSANTDLANSDALKMAQSCDPTGTRTIGVLTKLDLMDPGTDCSDILMNLVIPLRRGYIAVVNRGQKDVVNDVCIRDGLKKEEKFFRTHPTYSRDRNLLSKCGTPRLAKTLNSILMHHIRDVLPDLKSRIAHMMNDVQQELDALGTPAFNASRSTRGAALLGLLSKFATNFGLVLDGHGAKDAVMMSSSQGPGAIGNNGGGNANGGNSPDSELFGGARISYIFTQIFTGSLMSVGPFDGLSDDEIRTTICNANGTRPALFVPEISFDILVRRQVTRLEQPGIQCVDLVFEELQRIASQAEPKELTRFPVLRDRMLEVVANLLRRAVNPTQLMVSNLVKIELAYINTSHPDFIGGSRAVARLMDKIGKENDRVRAGTDRRDQRVAEPSSPLSNTSVNNYDYEDAKESSDVFASPENTKKRSTGGGGIMDVIFGGNKTSSQHSPHRSSRDRNPRSTTNGPPTIVHLPKVPQTMKQTDAPPTEREQVEMEVIKSLMESYFAIVQKNFCDMVPKTIMYFLVNHVRDSLQNELVSELYRDAEVGQLMQEADDIAERRQSCMEMKELLGKALDIVNEVRDFNTFK